MTDLTEQMHKGELPYAEYYIKLAGGEYTNDVWDIGGWQSFNKKGDVVVEVLAPVPSYEEWQVKSETLVQALERCERLEKQLKIADSYLQVIVGLKGCKCFQCVDFARRARKKIKELKQND